MHASSALSLATLLAAAPFSGCLGVDNMEEFKAALGFHEVAAPPPSDLLPPIATATASASVVRVQEAVVFEADGSDPQGLPLLYRWDFGDGSGIDGARVSHAYEADGEYRATLTAESTSGLSAADSVSVIVTPNRAPVPELRILRNGATIQEAILGEPLTFSALGSEDPDADPLSAAWGFGDGSSAQGLEATHGFARGGRYAILLTVRDPYGGQASASAILPVAFQTAASGTLHADDAPATFAVPVEPGAARLHATLRFDAGAGANDLTLRVYDADRAEAASSAGSTPLPSSPGENAAEEVTLSGTQLADRRPGVWTVVVERASGVSVDYVLAIVVGY